MSAAIETPAADLEECIICGREVDTIDDFGSPMCFDDDADSCEGPAEFEPDYEPDYNFLA